MRAKAKGAKAKGAKAKGAKAKGPKGKGDNAIEIKTKGVSLFFDEPTLTNSLSI